MTTIAGTAAGESINGTTGNDSIEGGDGNDTIDGGAGNDLIHGGNGDDVLLAGAGNDTYHGDAGVDTLSYANAPSGVNVTKPQGTFVFGTASDGFGGTDTFREGTADNLIGSDFNDTLAGSPVFISEFGEEFGRDFILGGGGNDSINGLGGDDTLGGGSGNDTIRGGEGNDSLLGGFGNDTYHGDAGIDILSYANAPTAVQVTKPQGTFESGTASDGFGGTDTFPEGTADILQGSDFDDTLAGSPIFVSQFGESFGSDDLRGGAGNDSIDGLGGDDFWLSGGAGNDIVHGGEGSDAMSGGSGNDTLDGGSGIDTAWYPGERSQYEWSGTGFGWQVSGEGSDLLAGTERLAFADTRVALDLDGNAGVVARILGAAFGPAAVQDAAFVGIGLQYADGGLSYEALMGLALEARLGPNASNEDVVSLLYTNVMGQAPDAGTRDMFVSWITGGSFTQASLGVLAAGTAYNAQHIGLSELAAHGLAYS